MSPKQTTLYWSFWNRVCTEHGWKNNDSTRRYALHTAAGCAASMKAFTNRDLDRYLSHCRQLLGAREDITVQAEAGERRRLIWRIQEDAKTAGLADAYLDKIATDQFGLACWRDLSIQDLTHLRNIMHNRAGTKCGHDTRTVQAQQARRRYILRMNEPAVPADLQPF
jgi:hypothetical protein